MSVFRLSSIHRLRPFALAFAAVLSLLATAACATKENVDPATKEISAIPGWQIGTSVWDYNHGVNPVTNVRLSGPYDYEDWVRGPNGFPLPGWAQVR